MSYFPKLSLFLGGARSGKSGLAENLVLSSKKKPVYLATAEIWDAEMRERKESHAARRGENWHLFEEPIDAAKIIAKRPSTEIVLLDCVTLWLSNQMHKEADTSLAIAELLAVLENCACDVVCVSNEVGMGIVPENALARQFRDAQGRVNQLIAAQAELVVFSAAGLPMVLKGAMPND